MSEHRNLNHYLGVPDSPREVPDGAREALPSTPPLAGSSPPPPDVALLLRAHSEQYWLSREVIPVVRQIETGERLPEEQLPAAVAYLEVIWAEASSRARETDTALRQLEELELVRQPLAARARRYRAAVRTLREATARRVTQLIAAFPLRGDDAEERGERRGLISQG